MATLIVSSDLNPIYLDFIEIQKNSCQSVNLDLFICKCGCVEWKLGDDYIEIPRIDGVPDVFVSLVSRFLIPCFFEEELFVVGDIDMLFLNKNFVKNIVSISTQNSGITFVDSNTYESVLRFASCYTVGFGKYFNLIFNLEDKSFDSFKNVIQRLYWEFEGWTGDELLMTQYALMNSENMNILHYNVRKRYGKIKGRINRDSWKYSRLFLFFNLYIDAHCVRPIGNNQQKLKHLFNYILCDLNGFEYFKFEIRRLLGKEKDLFEGYPQR